ncbi:MAG TPA: DUF5666 domain-containing protein [Candidatus Limnocylindrales bacterium]|nr:DUF5666 domain-containing protein [Candidatus Limnocylindrales bacterium]
MNLPLRASVLVGALMAVAIGAVTLAASPAPSPSGEPSAGTVPEILPALPGLEFLAPDEDFPGRLDGFRGGPGHGPFGQISVTAIDGSTVSLKTEDGWTRTITVTDSTRITKGDQEIGLDELAVGDVVGLAQTRSDDGTYTVVAIEVVVPRLAGTVTAVNDASFTITGRDGLQHTITTTDETAYRLGRSEGSRSDVTIGARIVAAGETASDGSFTATTVTIVLPRVAGEVNAIESDTITIDRRGDATLTINVTSATTYDVAGVEDAGLDDISVGMFLIAEGRQAADGSFEATAIHAGAFRGALERGLERGLGRGFRLGPSFPDDWPPFEEPAATPSPSGSAG